MTRLFDDAPIWDDDEDCAEETVAFWDWVAESRAKLRAANNEPEPEPIRPMGCLPDEETDDLPY